MRTSIGRARGFNSSMMLWHAENALLQTLFWFLEKHYAALLNVTYKFDHYLEMMLYKHLAHCSSNLHSDGVHIVQAAAGTIRNRVDASHADEMHNALDLDLNTSPSIRGFYTTGSADKFCYYIQDVCPGSVIDYFALKRAQTISAAHTGTDHLCDTHDAFIVSNEVSASSTRNAAGAAYPPCIVCFPLKPKPHELLTDPWIQEHWLGAAEGAVHSTGEEVD